MFEEAERDDQAAEKRAEQRKHGYVIPFFITMDEAKRDLVKPIIVLDATLGACGFHEHSVQDERGKWGHTEICVKDWANCPICASGNLPSFVLKLTVLDLTPYTIKQGDRAGQVIPYTKKILTIKRKQRAKWREIEQNCIQQNGTFRGCYLELRRDKTDSNSASSGEPQQIAVEVEVNGAMRTFYQSFDFLKEADLIEQFGNEETRDSGGKVTKTKNFDITPYDYAVIFPEPDVNELIRKYGDHSVGSAHSVQKEWEGQAQAAGSDARAPAATSAANAVRSRLRSGASAASAAPAAPQRTPEQEFEEAPQGTPGTMTGAVVEGSDDEIPFG